MKRPLVVQERNLNFLENGLNNFFSMLMICRDIVPKSYLVSQNILKLTRVKQRAPGLSSVTEYSIFQMALMILIKFRQVVVRLVSNETALAIFPKK
jgi:hypothetical protein